MRASNNHTDNQAESEEPLRGCIFSDGDVEQRGCESAELMDDRNTH